MFGGLFLRVALQVNRPAKLTALQCLRHTLGGPQLRSACSRVQLHIGRIEAVEMDCTLCIAFVAASVHCTGGKQLRTVNGQQDPCPHVQPYITVRTAMHTSLYVLGVQDPCMLACKRLTAVLFARRRRPDRVSPQGTCWQRSSDGPGRGSGGSAPAFRERLFGDMVWRHGRVLFPAQSPTGADAANQHPQQAPSLPSGA